MVWTMLACLTPPGAYDALVEAVIDGDGDGYYETERWAGDPHLEDLSLEAGDCDDQDAAIHPGAEERCDGVDNDCDDEVDEDLEELEGWFVDGDRDGFGDPEDPVPECPFPENAVQDASDCDDEDAGVFPGADEACNEADDDCDGAIDEGAIPSWYRDEDGDDHGTGDPLETCDPGDGYTTTDGDCDDDDAQIHPGVEETCNDGIDNDCDPTTDCRAVGDVDQSELNGTHGESEGKNFGAFLALGDIDGAAANDLLVGAPDWDDAPGRVYLFKDGVAEEAVGAHAIFEAAAPSSGFGFGVELYDLDVDGRDEVIVGADRAGGQVFVFERPWAALTTAADADATWTPSGSSGRFGHAVVGLADIDGAGSPGIAVGAITASDSGVVYALPHAGGGSHDPKTTGTSVVGESDDDGFGTTLERMDLDGDGVDELVVAAPGSDAAATEGGAVYAFSLPVASAAGDADWIVRGSDAYASIYSTAGADLDGDGATDLIVGAPSTGWEPAGAAFVFTDGIMTTTEAAALEVRGDLAYGALGYGIAALDLDNTGAPDLAVSAATEGAVHVFYDVEPSGVLAPDDADTRLVLTSGQKLPVLASAAWSFSGDSLIAGCPKCTDGTNPVGALLWLEASGP